MTNKKTNKKTSFTTTHSYKGRLEIVKNGMGYVMVEGLKKDIVIRQDKMGLALDGDDVRVEVSGTPKKNGRQDGIITDVIKRHQTEFSGTLKVSAHFAFLIPDKQNMPVDIFIPLELMHDAKDGDKATPEVEADHEENDKTHGDCRSLDGLRLSVFGECRPNRGHVLRDHRELQRIIQNVS